MPIRLSHEVSHLSNTATPPPENGINPHDPIHTGDFVIADAHGVIVFPKEFEEQLEQVISAAEMIRDKEEKIMGELKAGRSFKEALDKHKRF